MATDKKPSSSEKNNVSVNGDVSGVVIVGNENTVNQTIIQKFFNIFKSDAETLEQRNRRILLNHVENAWIKGVLDASLYGAAMLDLGIKKTPEAITNKYPWTLKKESTDETLPAGTSMLEIFDSIGMGRSLLILGAPGSGKTTMLLELARGLIARARGDVTQPIPMVFNLASWTEKLSLADWLAQELNNLYSVPRKTAPDWVKGYKLLLLLDGLDEVRQDSRAKCVEAINEFRKQNGLTSLTVCSRSQDYADLNAKLSFEGAIEVQPLTQGQIAKFFSRFGDEVEGIKQVLKNDRTLREMAETPLFLSIMLMAYRDKHNVDIWVSQDEKTQRKHLFDTYVERMFERPTRSEKKIFTKTEMLQYVSWLAYQMVNHNLFTYQIETIQPSWLKHNKQRLTYKWSVFIMVGLVLGMSGVVISGLLEGLIIGLVTTLMFGINFMLMGETIKSADRLLGSQKQARSRLTEEIKMIDKLSVSWKTARNGLIVGLILGLIVGLGGGLSVDPRMGVGTGLIFALCIGLIVGIKDEQIDETKYPSQRLSQTLVNTFIIIVPIGLIIGLVSTFIFGLENGLIKNLIDGLFFVVTIGLIFGQSLGINFGGLALIQHYSLRFSLVRDKVLPINLLLFLDHCVDLIFLRRVGGGYIFIHRLLMEHFAEMYVETPTSKGN